MTEPSSRESLVRRIRWACYAFAAVQTIAILFLVSLLFAASVHLQIIGIVSVLVFEISANGIIMVGLSFAILNIGPFIKQFAMSQLNDCLSGVFAQSQKGD